MGGAACCRQLAEQAVESPDEQVDATLVQGDSMVEKRVRIPSTPSSRIWVRTDAGDDDRYAGGHCLDVDDAERLVPRRQHEGGAALEEPDGGRPVGAPDELDLSSDAELLR